MEYYVSRVLPWSSQHIWQVLEDVSHFARDDPFHHDFAYLTESKSGCGTTFKLRHTYFPIFPLASDDVVCTITQWEPGRIQTLVEKNRKAYRTHVQRFRLIPLREGTLVEYSIFYRGLASWMVPLSQWVRWRVKQRMEEKLSQIACRCSQTEEQDCNQHQLCNDYEDAIPEGAGRQWLDHAGLGQEGPFYEDVVDLYSSGDPGRSDCRVLRRIDISRADHRFAVALLRRHAFWHAKERR